MQEPKKADNKVDRGPHHTHPDATGRFLVETPSWGARGSQWAAAQKLSPLTGAVWAGGRGRLGGFDNVAAAIQQVRLTADKQPLRAGQLGQ